MSISTGLTLRTAILGSAVLLGLALAASATATQNNAPPPVPGQSEQRQVFQDRLSGLDCRGRTQDARHLPALDSRRRDDPARPDRPSARHRRHGRRSRARRAAPTCSGRLWRRSGTVTLWSSSYHVHERGG